MPKKTTSQEQVAPALTPEDTRDIAKKLNLTEQDITALAHIGVLNAMVWRYTQPTTPEPERNRCAEQFNAAMQWLVEHDKPFRAQDNDERPYKPSF